MGLVPVILAYPHLGHVGGRTHLFPALPCDRHVSVPREEEEGTPLDSVHYYAHCLELPATYFLLFHLA